jgi:uncharacterized protein (TIGR04255 family)
MASPRTDEDVTAEVTFERAPLVEMSCGCRFRNLELFRIPHFGKFWSTFQQDFPRVEHATPIAPEDREPFRDRTTGLWLPRIWFIDDSDSELVQLQTDRLHVNWRKRDPGSPYGRFRRIAEVFIKRFEALGEFVTRERIGTIEPDSCELTYINHLVRGQDWETLADLSRVFDQSVQFPRGVGTLPLTSLSWSAVGALPGPAGKLSLTLKHGKRLSDQAEVFVFELTARGIAADRSIAGIRSWLDLAHREANAAFRSFTSERHQRDIWGRRDGTD